MVISLQAINAGSQPEYECHVASYRVQLQVLPQTSEVLNRKRLVESAQTMKKVTYN